MTQNTDTDDGTLVVETVEEIGPTTAEQTRLFAAAALLAGGTALAVALLALGIVLAQRRAA